MQNILCDWEEGSSPFCVVPPRSQGKGVIVVKKTIYHDAILS